MINILLMLLKGKADLFKNPIFSTTNFFKNPLFFWSKKEEAVGQVTPPPQAHSPDYRYTYLDIVKTLLNK